MHRLFLIVLSLFYLNTYSQNENYKWIYTPDDQNEIFLIDQVIPCTKDSGYIIQGRVRGKTDLNFSTKPADTTIFRFSKETYFVGKYSKDFALIWIKFLRIEEVNYKGFGILITNDIYGNCYWAINHDNTIRFFEGSSSELLPGNYNIIKIDSKGNSNYLHTSANSKDNYLFIYDLYADSCIYFHFYNKGNIDIDLNMTDTFFHISKYYFQNKYFTAKYNQNFKMTEIFYDTFKIYRNFYRDHRGTTYQFCQLNLAKDSLVNFDFKKPNSPLGGYAGYNYYLTQYDKDMNLIRQRRFLGKVPFKSYDLMHIYGINFDKDNNVYIVGKVDDAFNFQLDVTKVEKYIEANSMFFVKYDDNFNLKWIKTWPGCYSTTQILNPFSSNKFSLTINGFNKYFLDPGTNSIEVNSTSYYTSLVEFDTEGKLTRYLLPSPLLTSPLSFRSYDSTLLLFCKLEGILNIGTKQKENFIAGLHKSIIIDISDENASQSSVYTTTRENTISLFPNPSTDAIKIISGPVPISSAVIFNAEGKMVFEIKDFDDTKSISIDHLQNGIYIVKLLDINKLNYCLRFVKI